MADGMDVDETQPSEVVDAPAVGMQGAELQQNLNDAIAALEAAPYETEERGAAGAAPKQSVVQFTPLYGVSPDKPLCFFLQIDDFNLLLDCGWDYSFDEELLKPLKKLIPDIDAVLISHPSVQHLGGLAYAVGRLGLMAPIYCTTPVAEMGNMNMYDAYESREAYDFDLFSPDDLDATFERMTKLGYSQSVNLGDGLSITPFEAGHMLGGSFWRISHESTGDILYSMGFNHASDRHLAKTMIMQEQFKNAPILITDAYNATREVPKPRDRDKELTTCVAEATRRGGSVLLPCDAAGRVLELLYLLHALCAPNKKGKRVIKAPLVLLSYTGASVLEKAKQSISFMHTRLSDKFLSSKGMQKHPFDLDLLKVVRSPEELRAFPRPYVVLATNPSLETGLSQDVLEEFAQDSRNLVLFTGRSPPTSLAGRMMATPTPAAVKFTRLQSVLLEGEELEAHLEQKRQEQEQQDLEARGGMDSSESESEDEEMLIETAAGGSARTTRRRMRLAAAYPMYPCVETKRIWDVYGEAVKPEEFAKFQEQEQKEMSGEQMDVGNEEAAQEEDLEPAPPAPPRKTVKQEVNLHIRCDVKFVNMEGRAGAEAVKNVLETVAPHKLILVHGTEEGKEALKKYCGTKKRLKDKCKEVVIPKLNQCVDITSNNVVNVDLPGALMGGLDFVEVGDYEVARVHGKIKIDYNEAPIPMLQPVPLEAKKGSGAVFLGNVQREFRELPAILAASGVEAKVIAGVVVCGNNGVVQIRKVGGNNIQLRGFCCEEYFKIRQLLYGVFQMV